MSGRAFFTVSCHSTNMSIITKHSFIRQVQTVMSHAHHPRILNKLNKFDNLYRVPTNCRRPILISNASNMNAGLGVTRALGYRPAMNVSLITVYIGSVLAYKTRPLFFLSCLTANGLRPRTLTRIMRNVARNYRQTNYTLLKNRATRVPKFCTPNRCSLTNFYINIIRGSRVLSNDRIRVNSQIVNLTDDKIRDGNFDLIHGIIDRNHHLSKTNANCS